MPLPALLSLAGNWLTQGAEVMTQMSEGMQTLTIFVPEVGQLFGPKVSQLLVK